MPRSPNSRNSIPRQLTSSFFSPKNLFRPTYRHRKLKIDFLPVGGEAEPSPAAQRPSPYPPRRPDAKECQPVSIEADHGRIGTLNRWMKVNRLLDMPNDEHVAWPGPVRVAPKNKACVESERIASPHDTASFPYPQAIDPAEAAMNEYMTFNAESPLPETSWCEPKQYESVAGQRDKRDYPRTADASTECAALGALGLPSQPQDCVPPASHNFRSLSLSTPKASSTSSPSARKGRDIYLKQDPTPDPDGSLPSRTTQERTTDSECTPELLSSSIRQARRVRVAPNRIQDLSPEQEMIMTPPAVGHTGRPDLVRPLQTPSSSRPRQALESLRRQSDPAVPSSKGKRSIGRNNSLAPQDLSAPDPRRRLQVSPNSPTSSFGNNAPSPRPIPSRQISWREAERRGSLPSTLAAPFTSPPPPEGFTSQVPVPAIPSIFRTTPLPSPTEESGPSTVHPFLSTGYQFPAPSSQTLCAQGSPRTPEGTLPLRKARLCAENEPKNVLQPPGLNNGKIPVSPADSLLDDYYMDCLDARSDSDPDKDINGSPMISTKTDVDHDSAVDQSHIAAGALKDHRLVKAFEEKYELGDELGYGGFGFVCAARPRLGNELLGSEVAVKFVYKDKMAPETAEYYDGWPGEPYILSQCEHPNIVRFFDYFEDDRFFYYVTELHGDPWQPGHTLDEVVRPSLVATTRGLNRPPELVASPASSISDMLSRLEQTPTTPARPSKSRPSMGRRASHDLFECVENHRFTEEQARHVFLQLVSAVDYMHNKGFYHRDLKDENVVVDRDLNVKLIDFGSAVAEDADGEQQYYDQFRGTMSYAAPEIINGSSYRAGQADIWALGIILAILLTGASPFVSQEDARMGYIRLKTRVEGDARHLLGWCLSANAESRPTIAQVVRHPWCQEMGVAL